MNKRSFLFFLLGISLCFSCEQEDSGPKSLVNLVLVDSPATWDSVLVEIEGVDVEVLIAGKEGEKQTFYFDYKTGDKQIKISDLVGGNGLIIGREEIPAGKIVGLSVKMGKNHILYQGKKAFALPLQDPSKNLIPLVADLDLESAVAYDVILDMNLEKSILQKSSPPLQLQLAPSFTVVESSAAGLIRGSVSPVTLRPAIYLIQGTDSISTFPTTSGNYVLRADPGTYTILFDPKEDRYVTSTLTNVLVSKGTTTEIPPHTFRLKQ